MQSRRKCGYFVAFGSKKQFIKNIHVSFLHPKSINFISSTVPSTWHSSNAATIHAWFRLHLLEALCVTFMIQACGSTNITVKGACKNSTPVDDNTYFLCTYFIVILKWSELQNSDQLIYFLKTRGLTPLQFACLVLGLMRYLSDHVVSRVFTITCIYVVNCYLRWALLSSLGERMGASACSLGLAPSYRKDSFLESCLNCSSFLRGCIAS